MHIEAECKGCHKRYRVKEEFAGRVAECKHCGQKFRVPYRSAVIRLGDEEAIEETEGEDSALMTEAPPAASAKPEKQGRSFTEYGIDAARQARNERKAKAKTDVGEPMVPLPVMVSEFWLPLALVVLGYGISVWVAVAHLLNTPGPAAGILMLAVMGVLYAGVVVPMVIRILEGASMTFEFALPNAIRLQTAALIAMPTMGMTVGFFEGDVAGLIAGGVIGIALMFPMMALLHQAPIEKSAQAAVPVSLVYALTLGGCLAVSLGLGALALPVWKLNLPWRSLPEPTVAAVEKSTPAPAPAATQPVASSPVQVASLVPTSAPVIVAATEPVAPVKEEPKWLAAVDAPPQPAKWPLDLHWLADVQPPVTAVRSASGGSCVALIDQDSCEVYDLPKGKRIGSIPERFRADQAMLSASGKYLLAQHLATGAYRGASSGVEIWSTAEARLVTHIGAAGGVGSMRVLGFAGDDHLITTGLLGSRPVVQVWDAPSGQVIQTLDAEVGPRSLLSMNGRYLASLAGGHLRVHDLENARPVGESQLPQNVRLVKTMAFSPDGTALAAVVGDMPATMRIVVWGMADGTITQDISLPPPLAVNAQDELRWFTDGTGFLWGGDMIDRASGTAFYKLAPQIFSGAMGRPIGLLSIYHVLYEFLPSGAAGKVLYRSVLLPRNDINNALRAIRGPSWKPDDSAMRLAAATTTATSKPSLAALLAQKEWVISVVVVRKIDANAIAQQIDSERAKLPAIEQKIRETRVYADKMASESRTEVVTDGYDRYGNAVRRNVTVKVNSPSQIGDAAVAADHAVEERTKVNQKIARLDRDRKSADTSRTVVGKMDDGTAVEVDAEGAAMVAIADGLLPDSRWRVAGGARIVEGVLHVKARAFTAADQ